MAGRGLLLALPCVLAFGAGLASGWLLHAGANERAPLAAPSPASAPLPSEELAPLLRDLRRALEALTAEVGRREGAVAPAGAEPSQRRLPEESAPDAKDLASALKSLADAVQDLRAARTETAATRREALVPPPFVDKESAFAATGMERLLGPDLQPTNDQAFEAARNELNHSHLFLTTQAVLARYGMPDFRDFDGSSESWSYVLPRENGALVFTFRFHEGTVFNCEFDTQ